MPGMAAVLTTRGSARAKKSVDSGALRSISIDFDDGGDGGTVTCSYRGNDQTPFGGETKKHSFESHESILGFVRAKVLGTAEPADTAATKPAEGGPDTAPADEPDGGDDESAEGDE